MALHKLPALGGLVAGNAGLNRGRCPLPYPNRGSSMNVAVPTRPATTRAPHGAYRSRNRTGPFGVVITWLGKDWTG
jgi:hypothetical protein